MKSVFLLVFLFGITFCQAQVQPPKLMIGIVVDQMKYDFIIRYQSDFSDGGFNRLTREGFVYRNAHYNYVPTKTGPGHASIYTGTTPARHGIAGNDWYVPAIGRTLNCVEDTTEVAVGGVAKSGMVSTRNLLSTTVTDELRMFYNMKSKVIGISIKDRGASLPAGHNPTGAYWYDLESGNMITSTYYTDKLPIWVSDFNSKKRFKFYLDQTWDYYKDEITYNESTSDDNPFEDEAWKGFGNTFPYDYTKEKDNPRALKYSPFSNQYLREFVELAIKSEELGSDNITDFLTISFSATDDLGHRFGPRSREVQDIYLRLDFEISELLKFLDKEVGENNYAVFLTADHGASDIPSLLVSEKMPGGYQNNGYLKTQIQNGLKDKFGDGDWVHKIINNQVYINKGLIKEMKLDLAEVQSAVVPILLGESYIAEVFTATQIAQRNFTDPMGIKLQNGYNRQLSGDVFIVFNSGYLSDSYGRKGTDHISGYTYDTHIPIIFFGKGIKPGNSVRKVDITDIAPTVSTLLNITLPSAATGNPLIEIFE
ncbi:MAG: putative AlkP superfamily pyrophosphatase or phosphodiesterase [Cyclobacteriaceae bacterium]|jgi:predicted AlkP superfamily pyrophosphatase or phosphodiesterase